MPQDPTGSGMVEAEIVINGRVLTFAESMTVRVAVSSFAMYVNEPKTAKQLGPIASGYATQVAEVMKLIHTNVK